MDSVRECIYCQEIGLVVAKMEEAREDMDGEIPACITDHPGMEAVCLNVWTLQVAWSQYKQQYRHIAYRQFVRWCWDYLGKDTRAVIPSCAVSWIKAHFPPPGHEDDFTFRGHLLAVKKYPS